MATNSNQKIFGNKIVKGGVLDHINNEQDAVRNTPYFYRGCFDDRIEKDESKTINVYSQYHQAGANFADLNFVEEFIEEYCNTKLPSNDELAVAASSLEAQWNKTKAKSDAVATMALRQAESYFADKHYPLACHNSLVAVASAATKPVLAKALFWRARSNEQMHRFHFAAEDCASALLVVGKDRRLKQRIKTLMNNNRRLASVHAMVPVDNKVPEPVDRVELVENDKKKGKHHVAATDIERGADIFTEKPMVCTLSQGVYNRFCTTCLCDIVASTPCDKCRFALFCSDQCKKNTHHACSPSQVGRDNIPMYFMFAVDLYRYLEANNDLQTFIDRTPYRFKELSFLNFLPDIDRLSMFSLFREIKDLPKFFKVIQIVRQYAQPIYNRLDGDFLRIGWGFYPRAVNFRHSCDPNATLTFVDSVLCVVALKDIKEGEEITISYGASLADLDDYKQRQLILQKVFHFKCKCVVCKEKKFDDEAIVKERMTKRNEIESLSAKLDKSKNGDEAAEASKSLFSRIQQIYGIDSIEFVRAQLLFFMVQTRCSLQDMSKAVPTEDIMRRLDVLLTQFDKFGRLMQYERHLLKSWKWLWQRGGSSAKNKRKNLAEIVKKMPYSVASMGIVAMRDMFDNH